MSYKVKDLQKNKHAGCQKNDKFVPKDDFSSKCNRLIPFYY